MTQEGVSPLQLPHPWSKDVLLAKAQGYTEEMFLFSRDDWRFVLWSSLALELLARAALAGISPILLADTKDWNNLVYAIGKEPRANRFIPRSINVTIVLSRLKELLPDFTPEIESFCRSHMAKRNEELHSANTPFIGIGNSSWLPLYYRACNVLLISLGETLNGYLSTEEARIANAMIEAAGDESAKAVAQSIHAHNLAWKAKIREERELLTSQSAIWASRTEGHRTPCPACQCEGLINGAAIAAPIRSIHEDEITETQQYLPSKFECIACGLKIIGLSQFTACGLGDSYKATFTYDASDYYAPEDPYEEFEPDFNEP